MDMAKREPNNQADQLVGAFSRIDEKVSQMRSLAESDQEFGLRVEFSTFRYLEINGCH